MGRRGISIDFFNKTPLIDLDNIGPHPVAI